MVDAIVDTGPLVAYFCAGDAHHRWAVEQFAALAPPLLTCEPVMAETCFLLARQGVAGWRLVEKLQQGVLRIALTLEVEAGPVSGLMRRYSNVPMSLADACLVRLAEITGLPVCTLDSDFAIYRAHQRRPIELLTPEAFP
jgi:uncharacterized protein